MGRTRGGVDSHATKHTLSVRRRALSYFDIESGIIGLLRKPSQPTHPQLVVVKRLGIAPLDATMCLAASRRRCVRLLPIECSLGGEKRGVPRRPRHEDRAGRLPRHRPNRAEQPRGRSSSGRVSQRTRLEPRTSQTCTRHTAQRRLNCPASATRPTSAWQFNVVTGRVVKATQHLEGDAEARNPNFFHAAASTLAKATFSNKLVQGRVAHHLKALVALIPNMYRFT